MHSVLRAGVWLAITLTVSTAQAARMIAIMPLDVTHAKDKIDADARATIEEMLRDVAANALGPGGWTVLTGENQLQILVDNGIDPGKCGDQECHLGAARELKADLFISGTVQWSEGEFTASVRLMESKSGRIVSSERLNGQTIKSLRESFEGKADEFFRRAGLLTPTPAPTPAVPEPGHGVSVTAPDSGAAAVAKPQPVAPAEPSFAGWACRNVDATYVDGVGPGNGGHGIYVGGAPLLGDVNGDGKPDLLQYNSSWASIPFCLATDAGWRCTNAPATYVDGVGPGNSGSGIYWGGTPLVADVDGDGKADLIQYNYRWGSIPTCTSTGAGWRCSNSPATYVGGLGAGNAGSGIYWNGTPLVGDVNGDGKADLVQYDYHWGSIPTCLSTGAGWRCSNEAAPYVGGASPGNANSGIYWGGVPLLADVNGDGKADLIQFNSVWSTIPTCLSSGDGWRCSNAPATYVDGVGPGNSGSGIYDGATPLLADIDGDGKADLIQYNYGWGSIPVCHWSENGWLCHNTAATYRGGVGAGNGGSGVYWAGSPIVADVNGDGAADLVQYNALWGSLPTCLSSHGTWQCFNAAAGYLGGLGAGNGGYGVYSGGAAVQGRVDHPGNTLVQYEQEWGSAPVCMPARE